MSAAWIRPRKHNPSRRHPKGHTTWQVLYRRGGRETRIETAGSFTREREAKIRRDLIGGWLAAGLDPRAEFARIAESIVERSRSFTVEAAAALANATDEPVVIWCDLNSESVALTRAIPDAVEVTGSMSPEEKEERLMAFTDGSVRVLVTKPRIGGWGLNWQHCARVIFVGLSDSYESYYQAIRRCWRFGQKRPVDVTIIASHLEQAVLDNIARKQMFAEMVKAA